MPEIISVFFFIVCLKYLINWKRTFLERKSLRLEWAQDGPSSWPAVELLKGTEQKWWPSRISIRPAEDRTAQWELVPSQNSLVDGESYFSDWTTLLRLWRLILLHLVTVREKSQLWKLTKWMQTKSEYSSCDCRINSPRVCVCARAEKWGAS